MSEAPSLPLSHWLNRCFSELNVNPDLFPAYQRFMLGEIGRSSKDDGRDYQNEMDTPIAPEEPESETCAEYFAIRGKNFIHQLTACLKDGHMVNYAEAYATERLSDDYLPRVSMSAYEAIGSLKQPWTAENPGYQDVLHACLVQGKDEEFAHRCASELPYRDFDFKGAFEAAELYERQLARALAKGRSPVFAQAYAKAWTSFAEVEEVAFNYAECFEKLLAGGRSTHEADQIAYAYAEKHLEGYFDDDDDIDPDFELDKSKALSKAESDLRFRALPAEQNKLRGLFLSICKRKYPAEHSKQWFDDIETLARAVLDGNLKLKDIPQSSYMQYLEEENEAEKAAMPLRFDLMTDEQFHNFRPKSEEEAQKWDEEATFRAACRQNDLDPTDSDDRAKYSEFLRETGDEWWDKLDPSDRDGWIDNMNK